MPAVECPGRAAYQHTVECAAAAVPVELFRDSTILVTGATGLIGGALVRVFMYLNRVQGANIKLLCPVRSIEKARQVLEGVFGRKELNVFEADIEQPLELFGEIDYIVHGAAITASRLLVSTPVEAIKSSVAGTLNLLDLAREKQVRGMVYLSSMEAFGVTDPGLDWVTEEQLGYIDLSSVRSCYGESKRMCEMACRAYQSEYGVPVSCIRLAQTFGAGILQSEGRVFKQFAAAALRGENLVLHTRGESTGNYVHIADALSAILMLLYRGTPGETYTCAGDECCVKIKELARLTSDLLSGGRSAVVIDIPEDAAKLGYAPDVKMRLSNAKLKAAGWRPRFGLADMIRDLGEDMAQ